MSEALNGYQHPLMQEYWAVLNTRFKEVEEVFEDTMAEALALLSRDGVVDYLEAASLLGRLGRGVEPMLIFLEVWPQVAKAIGEDTLPEIMAFIQRMQRSPNGKAIAPFVQSLPTVSRRLHAWEQVRHYLDLSLDLMERTTGSVHGRQQTMPSPGLPVFFEQAPRLLALLTVDGLRNWVYYGIRNYSHHPDQQRDFFSLQSADSRAVLQRERHGTLFADIDRKLDLYLRALWNTSEQLVPYSTAFHEIRQPTPYYDHLGMRVPDVFDDWHDITGIDRYRAVLAHMVGHQRWTTPLIADNWSPFQRMAVEFFEDCRIDTLLARQYPGLRRIFLSLHPTPKADACDPEKASCLRHRLAMLSRALLDPDHSYTDTMLLAFVEDFHTLLAEDIGDSRKTATLALRFVTQTRRQSDQYAHVHFDDTVVDYRDDNRHMWQFIEEGDEEESFDEERKSEPEQEIKGLPPRHYPEWEYRSHTYRPDWVSVYEALHQSGDGAAIDRLLHKHEALAKRLKRLFDLLKPQEKVRVRYQEEGSELDLDVALRSLIDFKSGTTPDMRINMSHRTSGRNIAVLLLLDLSQSLREKVPGSEQTILELSQEAVSLLAWSIERLGDPFAIAGFRSNTRHDVRYQHIKGFSESWDEAKPRLAAMEPGWSTRMGAAMRHAGHYLGSRKADKRLMLILTDGEPSDVDVHDERLLIEDARQAVKELDQDGIFTYCINLDAKADEYVGDIFGKRYSVIDNIARLPEKLPELFMALTK